jgi:hypothetical protein
VEPSSAYQPASTSLLANGGPEGMEAAPADETNKGMEAEQAPVAEARDGAAETPAPEPQVRPAPAHIKRTEAAPHESGFARVIHPLSSGLQQVGSSLGRLVSACQVAAGSGAGVPVLALAVLSVAAAFDRRRVLGTRIITDEDAPDLLYATEVIAPG